MPRRRRAHRLAEHLVGTSRLSPMARRRLIELFVLGAPKHISKGELIRTRGDDVTVFQAYEVEVDDLGVLTQEMTAIQALVGRVGIDRAQATRSREEQRDHDYPANDARGVTGKPFHVSPNKPPLLAAGLPIGGDFPGLKTGAPLAGQAAPRSADLYTKE